MQEQEKAIRELVRAAYKARGLAAEFIPRQLVFVPSIPGRGAHCYTGEEAPWSWSG
ncbi:hypothetical protein BDV23DRAFT_165090 [Aspergillus alliaceus]|uniref:Uncharacterized protein n=1 Tax=Petromyces alliaceus TaxID=209559 RepID=A0A5N7BUW5_PETAA|nr:hypothetical protein BDV23DRAFT_165090 [Aspergillus alliaceus]